ncbi:MAG TPA: biosynthetic arginine decarboxylase, partial [Phycisphaerales bacterium]|nr:biosynthetic arginine decarboxylase [Phycisphaerales bacterium]
MTSAPRQTDRPAIPVVPGEWSVARSEALYGMNGWGAGFFRINGKGHVAVTPAGDGDLARSIDLAELAGGLAERGLTAPVLVRFTDVLAARMARVKEVFEAAIAEEEYGGSFACVYPIKVNQQRHFVEALRDLAGPMGFGLEAGSKPELLAVLGMTENSPGMPIVCNGFKDDEYIETVILAHKLGRGIIPVIESLAELDLLLKYAGAYGVRPRLGVRIKPSMPGAGRWAESGGERSKFGLHAPELLAMLDRLKAEGMADCLKLVHFHVGSQVCDIRQIKSAVSELARLYCELRRMGAGLDTIDIGGGLGVDYDGSNSAWPSSVNYSLAEYASDVVYRIKTACDDAGQPHPGIISESGRALSAHSSVLIFNILGRARFRGDPDMPWVRRLIDEEQRAGGEVPQPVRDLLQAWEAIDSAES